MKKMFRWLPLAVIAIMLFGVASAIAGPLPGAIFTTTEDGSRVNANIYQAKEDVYLDGGPGPNAPVGAAGLPAGDYYFQVTDPSGKVLLSEDPIDSRKVRVNAYGVIDYIYPAPTPTKYKGKNYATHAQGFDLDHGEAPWNAITVQLMPYDNTPNPGGVYKVWMTPVGKYSPGSGKHGFVSSESKTDNYKVKGKLTPPSIKVRKFHDANANGVWDSGEGELTDWTASYVDPFDSAVGPQLMPFTVFNADTGTYVFTEQMKDGWFQTSAYVDGVKLSNRDLTAAVTVMGTDKEVREVWFGNAEKGCVEVFKYLDKNLNAAHDEGEAPVGDVTFTLSGTDIFGAKVGPQDAVTNNSGIAKWCNLIPGDYTVVETVPDGSFATTPVKQNVTVTVGGTAKLSFGNARYVTVKGAKFYDKDADGVWDADESPIPGWKVVLTGTDYLGNPVGPDAQFTGADGYYVWEDLLPGSYTVTEVMPIETCWVAVTPTFGTEAVAEGGTFTVKFGNVCYRYVDFNTKGFWHNKNGLDILAANPDWITYVNGLPPYAGKFTGADPLAQISAFLVDDNSTYQQLEQQLLAFIFNVKFTGASAVIGPDGPVSTAGMIEEAIEAWKTGVDVQYWVGVLDGYNNNDAVPVVSSEPCSFSYE